MASNWYADTFRDSITIGGLELECILGLYERERREPQRVVVDVTMALDVERAAELERLDATVDYVWVSTQIAFMLKLGRFKLLEAAAFAICRALLLPPVPGELRGSIQAIDLALRKPDALQGRGVPLLRIVRRASQIAFQQESKEFGTVDVIHETIDAGFYRLNVLPGRGIGLHEHRDTDESELVLSAGLYCQGEPAVRGTVRQWPRSVAHHYHNPTGVVQSLLCIDRPPFNGKDEIPSQGTPSPVAVQRVWDL